MLLPLYDALQYYLELSLRASEMLFRRVELEWQLFAAMGDEDRFTAGPTLAQEGVSGTRTIISIARPE